MLIGWLKKQRKQMCESGVYVGESSVSTLNCKRLKMPNCVQLFLP